MTTYSFRLAGHLDHRWEAAFDGFSITHAYATQRHPVTLLTGPVPDQAALYGLISRLRDLGVSLISVQPVDSSAAELPAP